MTPHFPGKSFSNNQNTLQEILERGYLKVGGYFAFPPFLSYAFAGKTMEWFDIDIIHIILACLSVIHQQELTVQYISCFWDYLIPSLKAGRFDIICSAMTITEARQRAVDFTRWYYLSAMAILVLKGNPLNIQSPTDLNQTHLCIEVMGQTSMHYWLQNHQVTENA